MNGLPEITEPVDLCQPDGRLNPAAVGWTRRPLHRSNLRGWGRTKRWEYWAVQDDEQILAVTVSTLDYAALHSVWYRGPDGTVITESALVPFARLRLPDRSGAESVRVVTANLRVALVPAPTGLTMYVQTNRVHARVRVERPAGHESLGVVVPWTDRLFQYTVKDTALPARGWVRADGVQHDFDADDTWAALDHGRGRWPYQIIWNWGSGAGRVDGHAVGVQVGGRWTETTGSTENALIHNGRVHHIGEELAWDYDPADWLRPWRIRTPTTDRADLTFTPQFVRTDRINIGILANDTHQCFGTWSGWLATDDGTRISVDGLRGWAEEVRNRW